MTTEEMKAALRQLHSELATKETIDPETRDLLRTLELDIHSALDQPESETAPDTSDLTTRLDSMAAQFETDHPQIAPVLRQVGDALARIGI